MELCRNKIGLGSANPRSLKVIGTDTVQSTTYDFLLVIHNDHGLIMYRLQDKRQFQSKIANFHPVYLISYLWSSPWSIITEIVPLR